jgi:hypothetical protein
MKAACMETGGIWEPVLSVAKIRWADNNADDLLLNRSAFNS